MRPLEQHEQIHQQLALRLTAFPPPCVMTIARGSSDLAARPAGCCPSARGPVQTGLLTLAQGLRQAGVRVVLVGSDKVTGVDFVVPDAPHELLDPLCHIGAFCKAVARLAEARGLAPDAPRGSKKVTKTL